MKIVLGTAKVQASIHQWAEGDIVLVRFEPEDSNLPQDFHYQDTDSRSMKKRLRRSENWIWYAGKVKRVNGKGDIFVKFFDNDTRTLTVAETRTEAKRTTKERLEKLMGKRKYPGPISNAKMVDLTGPLKARGLDEVMDESEETFESDLTNPVSKMAVSPSVVDDAYESYDWLGNWVKSPIYDLNKVKYVLPAVIVGFAMVRGKHSLLLKVDTEGSTAKFKTNWVVMELFDRSTSVMYEKLERFVASAKSQINRERVTSKALLTLRREAKKSKRFM